ncbi:hypothetical protein V6N13_072260 [Hibiscus sabdariffa]
MAHAPDDNMQRLIQRHSWVKSHEGRIKINVDKAYCQEMGIRSVGGVARDSNGSILASFAERIVGTSSASLTEATAFPKGIQLALRRGWTHATIKGDAINVVNRLDNPCMDLSTLRVQLQPTRDLIKSFHNLTFFLCESVRQ